MRFLWLRWLGLIVAVGCDEPQSREGGLLIGVVESARLCDVNAVDIRLNAQWEACLEDDPACSLPSTMTVAGDRVSCPSTDRTRDLGVRLESVGRYRVEVVTSQASGAPRIECFVDPSTDAETIEWSSRRVSALSPVVLDEHRLCP